MTWAEGVFHVLWWLTVAVVGVGFACAVIR